MLMKAMILAAGLGTRMRPLSENLPKAMIPFNGVPLVEGVIRRIAAAGIRDLIVNIHHLSAVFLEFLNNLEIPGVNIEVSDEKERLMGTGGAVLFARDLLMESDSFLIHNVDVYTNLDITRLIDAHLGSDSMVTMAVKKRPTSRSLLFNGEGILAGWRHNETGEERHIAGRGTGMHDYGNSCVQVVRREFLDLFTENKPLDLIQMYLEIAAEHKITAFVHDADYWYDLGRYENFILAETEVKQAFIKR